MSQPFKPQEALQRVIEHREIFHDEMIDLMRQVMRGDVSPVHHKDIGVFKGLPNPLTCTRYHSLAIERESLPDCLDITAWTDDGEIMGVRHKTLAVEGVQFHPESILTERGHDLLKNFLDENQQ